MGNTSNWDEGKKKWSKTKDALLSSYLMVFFQKVYRTRKPILYVDGFAGGGTYENGDKGSPLIALDVAKSAQVQSRLSNTPALKFIFAEKSKKRSNSLQKAIDNNQNMIPNNSNVSIEIDGYQKAVREAIQIAPQYGTQFFYIDPFGIINLDFSLFRELSEINGKNESGVEVLLNFSSVGFLREACCVMKMQSKIPAETEDSDEHFSGSISDRDERLSIIFGGDGWHKILKELRIGQIDFWQAENKVSQAFATNLSKCFKFVLNMPVKDHTKRAEAGGLIKYRMIHMTNHWMGCNEMNDNMTRRINKVNNPQLFPIDVSGTPVDDETITEQFASVANHIKTFSAAYMGELAAYVEASIGVTKTTHDLCQIGIAPLLDSGILERKEKLTTHHRPKKSFSQRDLVIRT